MPPRRPDISRLLTTFVFLCIAFDAAIALPLRLGVETEALLILVGLGTALAAAHEWMRYWQEWDAWSTWQRERLAMQIQREIDQAEAEQE